MPRSLLIGVAALTALSAVPACAQDRDDRPALRRLEWAGRPAATTAEARGVRAVIPHAGAEPSRVALRPAQPWRPTAGSVDGRPGLTPASAFSGAAAPAPVWTPHAAEVAPPPPSAERRPTPPPQPAPRSESAPRPAPAAVLPARTPERAPTPASEPQPQARLVQPSPVAPQPPPQAPQPVADEPFDPMAPRRDAPIFRVQGARQPAAPVAAPSSGAGTEAAPAQPRPEPSSVPPARQQGARYYSVHRQNGRAPDPTVLPEPVWLDRMPVVLDSAPQSEDLAAPPETPQMMRGADGRMRPVQSAQHDPIP